MARINSSLWWERENFFLNTCDEEVSTSSRQVPATHAIGKEDVSAEKLVSLWEVEAEATWAVSWHVEKFGLGPSGRGRSFFIEELGGVDGLDFLGETKSEHGVGFETEKGGVGMIIDGASSPLGDGGGVPNMVPMAVGEEEGVRFKIFCFEKIEKTLGGIDGEKVSLEVEKVGVGLGEPTRKEEGCSGGGNLRCRHRSEARVLRRRGKGLSPDMGRGKDALTLECGPLSLSLGKPR